MPENIEKHPSDAEIFIVGYRVGQANRAWNKMSPKLHKTVPKEEFITANLTAEQRLIWDNYEHKEALLKL